MNRILHLDFEVYCPLDLKEVGLENFIAHPDFAVTAMAWSFDDGPVLSSIALNRAICALSLGRYTEAELLRREALRMGRQHANYWAIFAHKRILANDEAGARSALKRCLALDPKHKEGLALLRYLNGQQP